MNEITIDRSIILEFVERYKIYNLIYKLDGDGAGEIEFTTSIDSLGQMAADTIRPNRSDVDIESLQSILEEQTSEKLQQITTTIKEIINDRKYNDIIGF